MRFLIGFPDGIGTSELIDMVNKLGLDVISKDGLLFQYMSEQRYIVDFLKPIALEELQLKVAAINPRVFVGKPEGVYLTIKTDTWKNWSNMESFRKLHEPKLVSRKDGEWVFEVLTNGQLALYNNTLQLLGLEALTQTVAF